MLAKKWRLGTDEDPLVLILNVQANFPEQRRAGWAPQWPHSHAQSARWINFGSFAKACHGKSFHPGFLFFLEQQRAHKYYSLTKNQERTTFPSTTSDRQKVRVKSKNVCKSKAWRDGANLKAHIASRSFPREIPVRGRFFERRFQPLSVGGFFSNQRESISRCPNSPFPSKTQNRQIARTSPLTPRCLCSAGWLGCWHDCLERYCGLADGGVGGETACRRSSLDG